jgi:tRNA(Ile)-lysidine synthase
MKKHWSSLAHQIYRDFDSEGFLSKKVILSFSGGADSMALVEVLSHFLPPSQVLLVHFHHGPCSKNSLQTSYRDQALLFCEDYARQKRLRFLSFKSERPRHTEEECREFRRQHLLRILKDERYDLICTAHHAEDLLETRLLKLIRGSGGEGLKAFQKWESPFLRPFLDVSKSVLREELRERSISFLEDPSNESSDYLRNWIRNEWLLSLEHRVPGGTLSMGRSLEKLLPSSEDLTDLLSRSGWVAESKSLNLDLFLILSKSERERVLAFVYRKYSPGNYSVATLKEVLKQVDKLKRGHRWVSGGLTWVLDDFGPGRNFLRFDLRS